MLIYEHYAIWISYYGRYDLSSSKFLKLFSTENDLLHILPTSRKKYIFTCIYFIVGITIKLQSRQNVNTNETFKIKILTSEKN